MANLGRKKLPVELKRVPIVTNTLFLPSELKDFGGKDKVKQRIKEAIKTEFYGE
jgi:hypothetical protein